MEMKVKQISCMLSIVLCVVVFQRCDDENEKADHVKVYRNGTLYEEYFYYSNGKLKSQRSLIGTTSESIHTYSYEGGKLVSSVYDGTVTITYSYHYHEDGKLDYYMMAYSNGEPDNKVVYVFDENDRVKQIDGYEGNSREAWQIFEYSENGYEANSYYGNNVLYATSIRSYFTDYLYINPELLITSPDYYLPHNWQVHTSELTNSYGEHVFNTYSYEFGEQNRLKEKNLNNGQDVYTYEYD